MKIQTSVRVEDVFYNEAKEVFQKFGTLPKKLLKKKNS